MRSPFPSFPRVLRGDTPQILSRVPLRGLPLGFPAPCLSAFTSFSSSSPSREDLSWRLPLTSPMMRPMSPPFLSSSSRSTSSKGLRFLFRSFRSFSSFRSLRWFKSLRSKSSRGRISSPFTLGNSWQLLDLPGSFFRMGMVTLEILTNCNTRAMLALVRMLNQAANITIWLSNQLQNELLYLATPTWILFLLLTLEIKHHP